MSHRLAHYHAPDTENGIGRHIWTIDMSRFPLYLKIFYVSIVMYGAAITAVKATFLLQYQRVFSVGGYVNRFLWAFIVVMAWSVASLLIAIFTCVPVASFWDQSVTGHCVPEHPWWEINSAGNVITDFAVFCLPLPTLWRLHLPRPQKIALLGLFSLGFLCVIHLLPKKHTTAYELPVLASSPSCASNSSTSKTISPGATSTAGPGP